jgi:hypothetical protein
VKVFETITEAQLAAETAPMRAGTQAPAPVRPASAPGR